MRCIVQRSIVSTLSRRKLVSHASRHVLGPAIELAELLGAAEDIADRFEEQRQADHEGSRDRSVERPQGRRRDVRFDELDHLEEAAQGNEPRGGVELALMDAEQCQVLVEARTTG